MRHIYWERDEGWVELGVLYLSLGNDIQSALVVAVGATTGPKSTPLDYTFGMNIYPIASEHSIYVHKEWNKIFSNTWSSLKVRLKDKDGSISREGEKDLNNKVKKLKCNSLYNINYIFLPHGHGVYYKSAVHEIISILKNKNI